MEYSTLSSEKWRGVDNPCRLLTVRQQIRCGNAGSELAPRPLEAALAEANRSALFDYCI